MLLGATRVKELGHGIASQQKPLVEHSATGLDLLLLELFRVYRFFQTLRKCKESLVTCQSFIKCLGILLYDQSKDNLYFGFIVVISKMLIFYCS